MSRTLILKLGLSLSYLFASSCVAAFDFSIPITIQSDHLEYDHRTGKVTHSGHVVVKQNNKLLKAQTLFIERDTSSAGGLSKMVAKGTPKQLASFQGKLSETQPLIEGQAQTIIYYPKTQKLVLEGQAFLKKEQDTFTSPSIQFDIASSIVTANKDEHNNRPTLVIYKNDAKK